MQTFSLQTNHDQAFYDITESVARAVKESGVKDGLCVVYCPHTTAGITINENADPYVAQDVLFALNKTFPKHPEFRHDEGNSAAHVKTTAAGASTPIPVNNGALTLGRWQSVYFCEFDGPRTRQYFVQIIGA